MIFSRFKTNYDLHIQERFKSAKEKVGFLIYCWLEISNSTQEGIAKKINMKQSAISRLMTGKVSPSIDTLERIAKSFDCRLVIDFVKEDQFTNPES